MRLLLLTVALAALTACDPGDESVTSRELAVETAPAATLPAPQLESNGPHGPKPHEQLKPAGPAKPEPPTWPRTNPEDTGIWNAVEAKGPPAAAVSKSLPVVDHRIIVLQARYLEELAAKGPELSRLAPEEQEVERQQIKREILGF